MTTPARDGIPAARCICGHWAKPDEVTACRFCDCTEHRPQRGPYGGNDPQTPVGAEVALEYFRDAMEAAQLDLAAASDAEVEAELARDAARMARERGQVTAFIGFMTGVLTVALGAGFASGALGLPPVRAFHFAIGAGLVTLGAGLSAVAILERGR